MIGEEVRRRREGLGLTGAQLATKAGMAPSAISQIETGKRTPSSASVIKLAEALGAEVGDLYPKKAQAPLPLEDTGGRGATEEGNEAELEAQDLAGAVLGRVRALLGDARLRWSQETPPASAAEVRKVADVLEGVLNTPGLREAARAGRAAGEYLFSTTLLRNLREAADRLENADSAEERREAFREVEEAAGRQA